MKFLKAFFNKPDDEEGSTLRAMSIAGFAAFGGLLYGYDTGTISGVLTMQWVLDHFPRDLKDQHEFSSSESSLITSILSAGTFFGAIFAPTISDTLGRRIGLLTSCIIFTVGVILQTISTGIPLLVVGRLIAGLGVGVLSAIVPLYQSEASPKWIRGPIVSLYQFCITIGLLLAAIINQATHAINSSASYRIPIALQLLWGIILFTGMFLLPESPRFYVKKGKLDKAAKSLSVLRGVPIESDYIKQEVLEIEANHKYELSFGTGSWLNVVSPGSHQLRRLITGCVLQALQQLTGVNFIFYYGTTFFKNAGIQNAFIIQMITNVVNVVMTIPGILAVEKAGRRGLLIGGAIGMCVSDFIVAIVGTASPNSGASQKVLIAFACTFIASFASTWGPVAWVVCGEIFPLRTRAKSLALCTASNWLFNWALAYATPYLVNKEPGSAGLESKVFFIWGGFNFVSIVFAYFMIYETKGLTLEQVDELYDNCPSARVSPKFHPSVMGFQHDTQAVPKAADEKIAVATVQERA